MGVQTHPKQVSVVSPPRVEVRVIESRRRAAKLHLVTYLVGSAFFWTLWASLSVSAERWYWWLLVPFAAWTLVLALQVWHAYRK